MFDVRCSMFPRYMESLLSLLRMHRDHEPTPSPSQEGNREDADECLLPSWEGPGVGRFMERESPSSPSSVAVLLRRSGAVALLRRMEVRAGVSLHPTSMNRLIQGAELGTVRL